MTGMLILNSTEVLAAEADPVHELAPAPKVMDMDELLARPEKATELVQICDSVPALLE